MSKQFKRLLKLFVSLLLCLIAYSGSSTLVRAANSEVGNEEAVSNLNVEEDQLKNFKDDSKFAEGSVDKQMGSGNGKVEHFFGDGTSVDNDEGAEYFLKGKKDDEDSSEDSGESSDDDSKNSDDDEGQDSESSSVEDGDHFRRDSDSDDSESESESNSKSDDDDDDDDKTSESSEEDESSSDDESEEDFKSKDSSSESQSESGSTSSDDDDDFIGKSEDEDVSNYDEREEELAAEYKNEKFIDASSGNEIPQNEVVENNFLEYDANPNLEESGNVEFMSEEESKFYYDSNNSSKSAGSDSFYEYSGKKQESDMWSIKTSLAKIVTTVAEMK